MADVDELPSLLWGLDTVFSAYPKLYIIDILEMGESRQVPGVYFYKTHPVSQVDVLGTVVCKREREDFYCYGVDDSTGVINCLCWKDEKWRDQGEPATCRNSSVASGGFNIEDELKRLKETQRKSSVLEIGDLLRVRGAVKTSRGQREIKASCFYKVDDPLMAVQISRMVEMPQLYRKWYDKPFQVPGDELCAKEATGSTNFQILVSRSVLTLQEFLSEKGVARFRPYDVEFLLHPLVQNAVSDQVTEQDKDLHTGIKNIIREDTKREKYAEKGCHILHLLSSIRQRYSQNISREALQVALTFLECNSDIISTTEAHYTIL
ncbi:CST complex subunit STN1 [Triplophysa tibetana]|uniref:CST complex subunit STN1 n=1 Tax=Triplophysa tibetana TaxID=1572043 RepID=A0A5A9PHT3_9TELE|nr:CST complex subunit STN1 [Triplophysa tibetana]